MLNNFILLAQPHHALPIFLIIPFLVLIGMIAAGPIFFGHFWEQNYKTVAVTLGLTVLAYYLFVLQDYHMPAHTLAEYASFAILLSSLYIAAGGIYININANATPAMNVALVAIGAVLANFVGTTGASLLLIRPFIRLNVHRIKPYQIVFFIFIVSNAGGLLTPLGDPPLFIGFLKGVPFFWTLQHLFVSWVIAIAVLCLIFFLLDSRNKEGFHAKPEVVAKNEEKTEFYVTGKRNLFWLAIIIGAIFLDPNVVEGLPYIPYDGNKFSFIREIIQLSAAFACYRFSSKTALAGNQFNFHPILEVVFLFFGIFFTMMPALQLSAAIASAPQYAQYITPNFLYWATGSLSGFLDNAPTYANFLSLAMAKYDMAQNSVVEVRQFATGTGVEPATMVLLEAISLAAVLFGAFTYIGNGPNFMVKAIAESAGIKMPTFFAYIVRFSIPFLLPALLLVWYLSVYLQLF
ncbi:UIT6 family transporter [Pontibacter ummariensis]|uniref:Transporter, UIT6 family n=1 Tax=Pontibacter ummariensis TaxID=1610492 RepID=A0A239B490_9BACT|nr:sodium:proton antiporter [Pontibacter ummariensis]PRY16294.1 UIT6 family transporter [Pontibacter ummariensis]SNS02680.1 transporter, UIT6 family [Pontibacter ummariensis]